jgi:hypothetical protein
MNGAGGGWLIQTRLESGHSIKGRVKAPSLDIQPAPFKARGSEDEAGFYKTTLKG